jgi:hypothetical protein
MRKKSYNMLILLIGCLFCNISAFSEVLYVPEEYPDIAIAVNDSKPGDTIKLAPGTYYETVTLKPYTHLEGSGFDYSIIDAKSSNHDIIMASGCEVSDIRIMNAIYGIEAKDVDKGKVNNCHIETRYFGIWSQNSSLDIYNNYFYCTYADIQLLDCYSTTIINNRIEGRYIGIWCEKSNDIQILRNIIAGMYLGINSKGSDPIIANNYIIYPLHAGIACESGSKAIILNNTICGSMWWGFCTIGSSPIFVNNIIAYNKYGVDSDDYSNLISAYNIVSPNRYENYNGVGASETDLERPALLIGGGTSSDVTKYTLTDENAHFKPGSLDGYKIVPNIIGEKFINNGPDRDFFIISNNETTITVLEEYETGWVHNSPDGMLSNNFAHPGDIYFMDTWGFKTKKDGWISDSPAIDGGYPDLKDTDGTRSDIGTYGGPFAGWIGNQRLPFIVSKIAKHSLISGDHLHLVVYTENMSITKKTVDIYKILESDTQTYFFDSQGNISDKPAFERRELASNYRNVDELLNIHLSGILPSSKFTFRAKLTDPGTDNLICPESTVQFQLTNVPHAEFTVTPETGKVMSTIFYVDASASTDVEDPTPILKVCWQWEDGWGFNAWTAAKKAQHKYPAPGTKTITLQVMDLDGNVSSATQQITVTE